MNKREARPGEESRVGPVVREGRSWADAAGRDRAGGPAGLVDARQVTAGCYRWDIHEGVRRNRAGHMVSRAPAVPFRPGDPAGHGKGPAGYRIRSRRNGGIHDHPDFSVTMTEKSG